MCPCPSASGIPGRFLPGAPPALLEQVERIPPAPSGKLQFLVPLAQA